MKHFKRNNYIIATTVIVCMVLCILWATVFFVRRAKEAAESSEDISVEETSAEEIVLPDATEALLACNDRVLHAASFSSVTSGYCNTQVLFFNYRHELYSERMINADEVYCYDLGFGSHIRYAVSTYCKGDARLVRVGKVGSLDEVSWSNHPISLSQKAFTEALGQVQRGLSSYTLDKNTIRTAMLKTYTDQTYTFVYELDPSLASDLYAIKLKQFGALEELPAFDTVKMTVVMDHDFYPISVTYQEKYSVSLSMVGKTTCNAEYTETFSDFENQVEIPDKTFFTSHLAMIAVDTCPALSAGYQLLLSFFEDTAIYDLELLMPDYQLRAEISSDTSEGALRMHSDMFDFLYQNDRYHFSHGDCHVFTEAEALNQHLLPLFSDVGAQGRAKNDSASDLFAGAEIKTEDGVLYISSPDGGQTFLIAIDAANMSLISAEMALELSGSICHIKLTKTDQKAALQDTIEYVDITESVSAVSFLTTLMSGNDLLYSLRTSGSIGYQADIVVSIDENLAFSALSASDALPIDVYLSGQELQAVWNDISVYGSFEEFASVLTAFTDDGVSVASEPVPTRLVHLSHAPDRITLGFESTTPFSVTLTSKTFILAFNGLEIELQYRGVSEMPPQNAPLVSNTLSASSVAEYLQGSFVPSLLDADSIAAHLELDLGSERLDGELLLNLSGLNVKFDTDLSGLKTSIVFENGTVYMITPIMNAFVELDRAEAVLQRLAALSNQAGAVYAVESSADGIVVTCDGTEFYINYHGTEIVLQKQAISVNSNHLSLYADDMTALYDAPSISHPNKYECIDLDLLSRRLAPMSGQTAFSFSGVFAGTDFSGLIPRLDFKLNDSMEIYSAAIDLRLNNVEDLHHIVFDGEAFYIENSNVKLFCLAEPLFSFFSGYTDAQPLALASEQQGFDLRSIRSVSYRNDILEIETDSFAVRIRLTNQGLETVEITLDDIQLSLQTKTFCEIALPSLDGYIDITAICDLLPKLVNTTDAGNFDFEGAFDLEVLTMRLKGILLNGTVDFTDDQFKVYVCIDVPYFYGLTSGDISLKQGNSLLRSCHIKSEIFVLDDRIYMCRTIYASYGYSQSAKLVYTEKKYMTIDELLLSPQKMLAFILNLDPDLRLTANQSANAKSARSFAGYGMFKRFAKYDEEYLLEFNPEALPSDVNELTLYTEADDTYITRLGAETTVSLVTMNLFCELTEHGNSKLEFEPKDFATYVALQD